jgi:HAD superfamily hydrolase (TIGR01509 family)
MSDPAACLFDLDGLLLDTEPLHARAWREAAARFGADLNGDQLLALRGRRRLDCTLLVLDWILEASGRELTAEQLLAVRQPIAEALLPEAAPMPGAIQLIERCHTEGIPMALATSSSRDAVALKARPHPWIGLIQTRVHGDDPELVAGKPAPDVFLLAASRLGVAANQCWAFEDSPAGARSAAAAGCRVHVLVPPGLGAGDYPEGVQLLDSLEQVELSRAC